MFFQIAAFFFWHLLFGREKMGMTEGKDEK